MKQVVSHGLHYCTIFGFCHEFTKFSEILLGKIHFIFCTCDSENKTSIQSTNQNKPRFKMFETLLIENRINSCATCGSQPDEVA